ncbi:MAG: CCA tRNA nucleotidyltransferase [Candidatus Gastranaerophilales bacterium]|nr:CCA tRNA nucleotidyltransferase [Candidatus Gastranaerophilales bacterium]
MKFNFSKETEEFLKIITKTAQANNVRVFFVGGIVRDNLLNIVNNDIDIIVEGNAIELSKKFPSEIIIKSVHGDFGTVKIEYKGINIDIASTRTEKYPYSGCLPEIIELGVDIERDVKRRDFTVNALYSEITLVDNKLNYKLIDLTDGVSDIKNKILRVLHKKSYRDDPTRILRGLNFKYRFGFDFSDIDKILISEYMKSINLENASKDRIKDVFQIVLSNKYQDEIFREIIDNEYHKIISNSDLSVDFTLLNKTLANIDLNIEEKSCFYSDILFSKEIILPEFKDKISKYKFYSNLNSVQKALLFYKTQDSDIILYTNIKINLKGKDLINLNYKEGKTIGEILDAILTAKLDNPSIFSDLSDEINWVKNRFPKK